MSRFEELMNQLCPNGVERKPLWQLTSWDKKFNGVSRAKQTKVIKYRYLLANDLKPLIVEGGDVKLLTTNTSNLWTTEDLAADKFSDGEVIAIPWGGNPNVQYYKGKFLTADNRIAISNDTSIVETKFLYYVMRNCLDLIGTFYRGSGIKHPSMSQLLDMTIPVPPIEVQREIVRILDLFTSLEMALEEELEARGQQFEFFRQELLSFAKNEKVRWASISAVCTNITSGSTPLATRSDYYGGDIPWLRTQEVHFADVYDTDLKITEKGFKNSATRWIPEDCVIVAISGATRGRLAINKIPLTTNQHCCNLEIDEVVAHYRYVYHWLASQYYELKSLGQGARSDLNIGMIKRFLIPLPPLDEQERIVAALAKFNALVNDLSIGLPAEITARRQQYEFYRDRLLTFDEVVI